MRINKRLVVLLVVMVALLGCLWYVYAERRIPCVTPTTYALTEYSAKFGVPEADIQNDIKQAAALWNTALGKEVFVEAAGNKPQLPIEFVYTAAQQAVDTVASANTAIDTINARQQALAKQYAALETQYNAARAHGEDTNTLVDQMNALAKQSEALRKDADAEFAKERNAVTPGEEIEGGRYVSDKDGERIFIYSFQNKTERLRALMHEFGHALGLEHVSGSDSIMYPINSSKSLVLSREDKAELARACSL